MARRHEQVCVHRVGTQLGKVCINPVLLHLDNGGRRASRSKAEADWLGTWRAARGRQFIGRWWPELRLGGQAGQWRRGNLPTSAGR